MAEEVRARLFEPFFTTKPKGKNSGLGLSTVYGIVKQSGGDIEAASSPGHGAVFRILLPPCAAEAEASSPRLEAPAPRRGTETVLLVEDEAPVRAVLQRALAASGYNVLSAGSGREALELLERGGPCLDLLVTDVVMPGMNGRELAEAVSALQPRALILFMSGYTDDVIAKHGFIERGRTLLPKPFSPGALTAKVREVLDAQESPGGPPPP
jgi:CheY-like chemotaxis protein